MSHSPRTGTGNKMIGFHRSHIAAFLPALLVSAGVVVAAPAATRSHMDGVPGGAPAATRIGHGPLRAAPATTKTGDVREDTTSTGASAQRLTYARLLEETGPSVVAVRFQLRPKERPRGGEGPKLKSVTCGVFAGPPGTVVITADPFPEIDDGPDALEPFDFRLVLEDGSEVPAEAAGVDRELNLGILRADPAKIGPARTVDFGGHAEAGIGDEVIVIGLLSEKYGFARTFYTTRVNGIIEKPRRMYSLDTPLQDLAIGGLAVLRDGRPLGIIGEDLIPTAPSDDRPTNVLSLLGSQFQGGSRIGYPMVFPYSVIARSIERPPEPIGSEADRRGWLGVVMQPLSRDLADYWKVPADGGVIIGAVVDGSPASTAGLKPGDVIIQVDGKDLPIRERADLQLMQRRIRAAGAGRAIPLAIWRDGKVLPMEVRLTSSPLTVATAEEYENESFGMKVRELTYDFLQGANLDPGTAGVIVVDLERAGWAQVSGLGRFDIIQRVGGQETPDIASFRAALEKAEKERSAELIFFVLRGYQTQFVRVKTDWKNR